MTILERLQAIQTALGLSEREFAARMGVSHATWNQTRRHLIPLNDTVLAGAMNAFPEMADDIIAYRTSTLRDLAKQLAGRSEVA